jgi:hypothetical protein
MQGAAMLQQELLHNPYMQLHQSHVTCAMIAHVVLTSMGVMFSFTLSRIMRKIFSTNASSCCLNSSAGYLASTSPPMPPPWIAASPAYMNEPQHEAKGQ